MNRRRGLCGVLSTVVVALVVTGCTAGDYNGSTGTISLSSIASAATRSTPSSIAPTPVSEDGLATGPGVQANTIDLGLLVEADLDRGFTDGARLWVRTINASGGVCGRTITLRLPNTGETPSEGYDRLGRNVLGFLSLAEGSDRAELAKSSSQDQIPVLTAGGSSTELGPTQPLILGATDDIKAINALAYLSGKALIPPRATVGIVTDGSTDSDNGIAGARWWAKENNATLAVRSDSESLAGWGSTKAILALTSARKVQALLSATGKDVTVVTTLDGYDPASFTAADKGRLLVTIPTPAYGSDHPAAAAVAEAFVSQGKAQPGPRLLSGYAVGASWGRLLAQACTSRALTRAGIEAAMKTVGPASVDSLFGPSDPSLVVNFSLPATRVSSMGQAVPSAPAGLTPLIWLEAAPNIADYTPAR